MIQPPSRGPGGRGPVGGQVSDVSGTQGCVVEECGLKTTGREESSSLRCPSRVRRQGCGPGGDFPVTVVPGGVFLTVYSGFRKPVVGSPDTVSDPPRGSSTLSLCMVRPGAVPTPRDYSLARRDQYRRGLGGGGQGVGSPSSTHPSRGAFPGRSDATKQLG